MKHLLITPDWMISSDLHIGHNKEFIWEQRGFSNPDDHHEFMLDALENQLKSNHVLVLGDTMFRTKQQLRDRLSSIVNSDRFFCIPGNHDYEYINKSVNQDNILRDVVVLRVGNKLVSASHYPMAEWPGSFHNSYHIHGHTHGNIPYSDRPITKKVRGRMDVSVDCLMSIFKEPFVSMGTLLDYIDERDGETK